MEMLRLGAHESIAGGLYRAFERGEAAGCESLQIWVKNSRRWTAPPLTESEIAQFKEAQQRTGIEPVVAHTAYLINIGSPEEKLYSQG
jgi:deoxyribonuclease-4